MSDQVPCSSNSVSEQSETLPELPTLDVPSSSKIPAVPKALSSISKWSARKQKRPSSCAVCGQPANGYHYEVASCNGCKSFFRRTLILEKSFVCQFNNDCFDLNKRDFPLKCRACRYEKCIELDMNPLAMQIDGVEANLESFKKISKRSIESKEQEVIVVKESVLPRKLFSTEEKKQKMIDMLTYLEQKVELFRKCAYNPNPELLPGLEALLQEHNKISMAEKAGPMSGWPLESLPPRRQVPCAERNKGDDAEKKSTFHGSQRRLWFAFDLLTTIEYAKTFGFFHRLDMRDRVLLLKYVALVILNLHVSHFSMEKHFDSVIHPDGVIDPQKHGTTYALCNMSISPLLRYSVSSKEYILLKAICLCNPAVPELSKHAQEILLAERELYASALFDHCRRDPKLGPSHFAHLIGIIDTLEHQQKIQKDLHTLVMLPITRNFNPVPLIGDIMDN